jgi:hypothetical protein
MSPTLSLHPWARREVGDGNINFVYIVEGPSGCICVKQALPYVRIVGESWPLTQVGRHAQQQPQRRAQGPPLSKVRGKHLSPCIVNGNRALFSVGVDP